MTQVGDVMTKDPAYCTADTRIAEIKYLMKKYDYEEILVVDTVIGKRPVGVIHEEDMEGEDIENSEIPSDTSALDCMTPIVSSIREDASLEQCLLAMRESHMSRMPVIDSEGHYVGIVEMDDLLMKASV